MTSLIIFAGAGASRGVSGEKYPMALNFRERLPDGIKETHLYKQLLAHREQSNPDVNVDIEDILWELNQLNDALKEFTLKGLFASYLLTNNKIRSTSSSIGGEQIQNELHHLKSEVITLRNNINERVYEFYSQLPEPKELERSWLPLLKKISLIGFDQINIFTTNYDLVIESALESMQDINIRMGLKEGRYPGVDLEEWSKIGTSSGLLTKLHGSVDWKLGNGSTDIKPVIRRGHPEFDGDHDKRLILYPGFKGVPSREPFITFNEYFRSCLQKTTHMLFVGFAFRDEFINNLISDNLPLNSSVAVVNPAKDLPKLRFLTKAKHLQQGFGIIKNSSPTILQDGITPFSVNNLEEWLA